MMTKDMTEVWSKDFVPEGNRASNVDRFTGFEDTYDQHRPEAPQEVVALLTGYLERKPSRCRLGMRNGTILVCMERRSGPDHRR